MTSAQIAANLTNVLKPEIERLLREQLTTIADLEQRLDAANNRATSAEARLEQLRQVLNPAPAKVESAPVKGSYDRDHLIAAFHAKREIGPVSIAELGAALSVNKANAQWYYSDWCRRHDTARINYYSNGQRAD